MAKNSAFSALKSVLYAQATYEPMTAYEILNKMSELGHSDKETRQAIQLAFEDDLIYLDLEMRVGLK